MGEYIVQALTWFTMSAYECGCSECFIFLLRYASILDFSSSSCSGLYYSISAVWLGSIFSVGSLIGGYVAKVASCKIATKISEQSYGRKIQKDEGHKGDLKNYEDLKIEVLGDKISSETRNFDAGRI